MRELGGYQLLTRLSTGAVGELFLARPSDGSRDAVVLERVHPDVQDLHFTRTLNMEAPAGLGFSGPGAVRMLEVGQGSEGVFLVFEFVRGQPLSDVLRRTQVDGAPLPQELIAWVGAELAATLAAAHAVPWFDGAPTPLVHGTVSPRAILVTYDGRVVLSGLGYGRARARVAPLLARLPYIAPEVLRARELTARTDVYGLGVTLHHAFSGRAVYRRPSEEATRAAVLAQNAPPIPPRNLTVDPSISELLHSMMAARPEARPETLEDVQAELRSAAGADRDFPAELAMRVEALFVEEREAIERRLEAADRAERRLREGRPAPGSGGFAAPGSGGFAAPGSGGFAAPGSGGFAAPSTPPASAQPTLSRPGPSPEPVPAPTRAPAPVPPPPAPASPAGDEPEPRPASPVVFARVEASSSPVPESEPEPEVPSTPPAVLSLDGDTFEAGEGDASPPAEDDPFVELSDFDVTVEEGPFEAPERSFAASVFGYAPEHDAVTADCEPDVEAATASGSFSGLLDEAAAQGVVDHLPEFADPPAVESLPEAPHPQAAPAVLTRFTSGVHEYEAVEADPLDALEIDESEPARFGRYVVLEPVPCDARRARYLARDADLSRDVWIDVVSPEATPRPEESPGMLQGRFLQEARWLSRLRHPRLPTILDRAEHEGVPFVVQTVVHGAPLVVVAGWSEEAVRDVVIELAAALEALHAADLCAGGLRAHDVWIDEDGRANVVDLPRLFSMGTTPPAWLAEAVDVHPPERAEGVPFDHRADLFSLGLLAHRLLTGKDALPADADARAEALRGGQVPVPKVSDPKLQEALRRLLASAPRARLSSAAQLLELFGVADGPHTSASPAPTKADVVIVDPDLTASRARRVLAARGVRSAIHKDVGAALEALPRLGARTLVVARSLKVDDEDVRRRVAAIDRGIELRFVPRAAARLVGPPLSLEGLGHAWLTLAPRVLALGAPEGGFLPTTATRAMAHTLNLGLRAEMLASLTAGARMLARRLGESPAKLPVALPEEVPAVLETVERVDAGTRTLDEVDAVARVVVVADAFYRATRLDKVPPSRAISDLKENLQSRAGRRVIEALLEHLRELYATGDLAPPAEDAPRVLLARRARAPALIKMLEFDGLQVEEAADGEEAWELLRALRPNIAILDADLTGRDGASLVELSCVHPAMASIRFLLLGDSNDAALRSRICGLGQVTLVDRAASVEAIRARVSALVEA